MNESCIVDIRGGVYGPFPSRSVASDWASALAGEIAEPGEIISWDVRRLRSPSAARELYEQTRREKEQAR